MIRSVVPEEVSGIGGQGWLATGVPALRWALALLPFAGIAFLWFMGVIRSHLGSREDQFFSTVFFGAGLLFLAMIFVSAAIADGMINAYALAPSEMARSEVITFARSVSYAIANVYAVRMSAVFMISLGTIWTRTRSMPRGLTILTYVLSGLLLIVITQSLWIIMVFPLWVLTISVYILWHSMRSQSGAAQ